MNNSLVKKKCCLRVMLIFCIFGGSYWEGLLEKAYNGFLFGNFGVNL